MDHTVKLTKLIERIQRFAKRLENTRELAVHQHINHFYYMQKIAELNALKEQLDEVQQRLSFVTLRIEHEYSHIFARWSNDARWLQHYEMTIKN